MSKADDLIRQQLEATQLGLPGIARNQKIAPDRSGKRYQDRLAMDIHRWFADKGSEDRPTLSDHLRAAGHEVGPTDGYHSDYGGHIYDDVFEHPDITAHNQAVDPGGRGSAGIMSTYSGSLLRKKPGLDFAHDMPAYAFHFGRMGNSIVIPIHGPARPRSVKPTTEAVSGPDYEKRRKAYADGHKAGKADKLLGHRSSAAWHGVGDQNEYSSSYSRGYRDAHTGVDNSRTIAPPRTEGVEEHPWWTIRHRRTGHVLAKRRAPNAHRAIAIAVDDHNVYAAQKLKTAHYEAVPGAMAMLPDSQRRRITGLANA